MSEMSHEEGIEAAADEYDNCWHDSADEQETDKVSAFRIIKAYLDASGMVMVPVHMPKEVDERIVSDMKGYHDIDDRDWRSKCPKDFYRLAHMFAQKHFTNPFQTPEESRESSGRS